MLTVTSAASSHALITRAQAESELAIATGTQNAVLDQLIKDASAMITGWCGRDTFILETVRQTERLRCAEESIILERELNVTVTSIVEDGATLTTDDWERDGALLYRLDANDERTTWAAAKIVITYTAGFTAGSNVPDILQRAALDAVVNLYRSRGRDQTIRAERSDGVGETQYFDGRRTDAPPVATDRLLALARYRRMALA